LTSQPQFALQAAAATCREHFGRCGFTDVEVLKSELAVSEISGKRYRIGLWGAKWPSVGFAVGNAGHGLSANAAIGQRDGAVCFLV
jgi:hypothetical protein